MRRRRARRRFRPPHGVGARLGRGVAPSPAPAGARELLAAMTFSHRCRGNPRPPPGPAGGGGRSPLPGRLGRVPPGMLPGTFPPTSGVGGPVGDVAQEHSGRSTHGPRQRQVSVFCVPPAKGIVRRDGVALGQIGELLDARGAGRWAASPRGGRGMCSPFRNRHRPGRAVVRAQRRPRARDVGASGRSGARPPPLLAIPPGQGWRTEPPAWEPGPSRTARQD